MTSGCGLLDKIPPGPHDTTASYHDDHGLQIEYPEVARCAETMPTLSAQQTIVPFSLEDPSKIPAYDLSLEEAIRVTVEQSPVLRTIGGTVITAPQSIQTIYDPGIVSTSPTLGTEAALAAFDALYAQQLYWFSQDQPNNIFIPPIAGNPLSSFSTRVLDGRNATFSSDLSKQTAQGAKFSLRHIVNYTRNNIPSRAFRSAFDGWLEAEWRQPLMQGAGTTYNRIAGPTTVPGQYRGVLIARVNEDVALADFEAALIQLVSDVEQAYWDLTTAYRILDATVKGRDAAQETWQVFQQRVDVGVDSSNEEAQARSEFFQFQAQVEVALGGADGLYAKEQRLRYLMGLPATDGRIIRPTTEPTDVRVVFDWESALGQALQRRVEVRRQLFAIERREMELTAARLNLRPRLDFLAQYRWRGLGNHLIGSSNGGIIGASGLPDPSSNLYGTILGGNYQEGQAGFELNLPVGLRAASGAVANARLNLRRERAILAETEMRVSHDLSDAARRITLTHQLLETNYDRFIADIRKIEVLKLRFEGGTDPINFLLDARRQLVASASEFYRSVSEYNLAIRDFHRQKGSLLAYSQVQLAEGPWANGAAQDAYEVGRFLTPRHSTGAMSAPAPLASGIFDPSAVQDTSASANSPSTESLPPPAADPSIPEEVDNDQPISAPVTVAPTETDYRGGNDDGLISVAPNLE